MYLHIRQSGTNSAPEAPIAPPKSSTYNHSNNSAIISCNNQFCTMGQRHQLFIIARVGKYYRSLAVVHHQWLYGVGALRSCLRLVRIFSDPGNRVPITQELAFASEFYENHGPPPTQLGFATHKSKPGTVFPFISTCLAIGASFDETDGDAHAVIVLDHDMAYNQGDNNDGITVLDITNLDHVRYCFVNWGKLAPKWSGIGMAGLTVAVLVGMEFFGPDEGSLEGSRILEKPLTGWEYVLNYYLRTDEMLQRNVAVPKALEKIPLVELTALAETWPGGKWFDNYDGTDPESPAGVRAAPGQPVASLRDQAVSKLVDSLLSSDEFDPALLDEPRRISNFQGSLQKCLRGNKDRVGVSSASASLLKIAYGGESYLDLSPYRNLTAEVLKNVLADDGMQTVTSINLSGILTSSSPDEIVAALAGAKSITSLCLLDKPAPEGNLADNGRSIDLFIKLTTSALPIRKLILSEPLIRNLCVDFWIPSEMCLPASPMRPVEQLLISLPSGQFEHLFLGDILLDPARFADGFLRYLQSLIKDPYSDGGFSGRVGAVCFASASSMADGEDDARWETGYLPAEMYSVAGWSEFSRKYTSRVRDIVPGRWTALVRQTRTWDGDCEDIRLEYALVRSKVDIAAGQNEAESTFGADDLEVVDLLDFVRITAPEVNLAPLESRLARLPDIDLSASRRGSVKVSVSLNFFGPTVACGFLKDILANLRKPNNGLRIVHCKSMLQRTHLLGSYD